MEDLRAYLVESRNRLSITQDAMARALGVDKRTLQNWESVGIAKESRARAIKAKIDEFIRRPELLLEENEKLDPEKEALKKLVAAQEEIIRNHKVFVTAQLIRGEAYASETLAQLAELRGRMENLGKSDVEVIKEKYEEGVRDRIQRIRTDLGL